MNNDKLKDDRSRLTYLGRTIKIQDEQKNPSTITPKMMEKKLKQDIHWLSW